MAGAVMRYLSVCSGIEAATVAWHPLGFTPVAFAEVDKFPSAVLAHHYPTVPNLGDMTRCREWPDAAIDLLVGGTPCQSFSVAGLRAGLDDPRGSLMLTYLAVARRYRPEWLVWENVPGVLSADDGRAFGSLLGGLAELGYGFAYRVLDAQYFGLAQRRQRVFVVGHLGDWRRAAAVLFERASLSGHPAPRREAGQRVANAITERPDRGGGNSEGQRLIPQAFGGNNTAGPIDVATAVNAHGGPHGRMDFESETFIAHAFDARQSDVIQYGDQCGPLDTDGHSIGVAFAQNTRDELREMAVVRALASQPGMKQQSYLRQGMAVRRLTPVECERLQGFPDNYTLIPYRGKPAADGPRYKALGNSMAVPVMAWIGKRIAQVDAIGREKEPAA
jgi:DNA (cytosine-5)-methyltransferase 1